MRAMWSDLRYGARLFLRRPGFFLLVVLILGLGIGANTAIFGLVKQVLLRPLPYEDAGRLVRVSGTNRNGKGPLSYPDFLDLRERNRVFSAIAPFPSSRLSRREVFTTTAPSTGAGRRNTSFPPGSKCGRCGASSGSPWRPTGPWDAAGPPGWISAFAATAGPTSSK